MNVPLLDLRPQYAAIRDEIQTAMAAVCESQYFILGETVSRFEAEVAAYCGAEYACGVSSGSDALLIALMAEGIGPGDEVITSPYTFFATAGAVWRLGAKPVFVDIERLSFNLDPALLEARITPATKAIIPVHLFGQCADMDPLLALARKHGLVVIEDACQAIGAEYRGRRAGAIGDYGCFSFFPSKNLGGFGDGGMVLCADRERHDLLCSLRNHGAEPKYYHQRVGGNFRLDALQAAVLSVKLKYLDAWTSGRQQNADAYERLFGDAQLPVTLPTVAPYTTRHVYNQFCIRLPAARRDRVWGHLRESGVGCEVYYPVPLHLQECFAALGGAAGDFPESEAAARESLALPIYPDLTQARMARVTQVLAEALQSAGA